MPKTKKPKLIFEIFDGFQWNFITGIWEPQYIKLVKPTKKQHKEIMKRVKSNNKNKSWVKMKPIRGKNEI